jgi:hypothetical protein
MHLGATGAPAAPAAKPATPSVAVPVPPPAPELNTNDLMVFNPTPYHPNLVRDPFAAPTDAEQVNKGDFVDDIAVKGRVVSEGRTKAVVSDARGNIRWLPVGYRFRDGELVAIGDRTVTFHQWDPSSTNTKVYRTVVKIYKREEGKR